MCCTWLAEKTGRKNDAKIAIWAPSHNFVGLYFSFVFIDWFVLLSSIVLLHTVIVVDCILWNSKEVVLTEYDEVPIDVVL